MIPLQTITENKTIRAIVRTIIIIIILWLIWTLGKDWLRPTIIKGLGGYTNREYKETVDTLSIQRESIMYKYANLETLVENMQEAKVVYKYKYKDRYKDSTSSTTKGNQSPNAHDIYEADSVYVYTQGISDTLIDGKIRTVIDMSNCKIVEQSLNYKPKFPIIVKETVTIEKVKETTLSNKKAHIGIGGVVSSKANVGVVVAYQTKSLLQFQVGYNLINNQVVTDKTRKNEISIGIIKLF